MIEWDKWNQQLFLGVIAKDGINLQKLLQNPLPVRKPRTTDRGGNQHASTRSQSKKSREASDMRESMCTFKQPRANSRWCPVGGSRHQIPKLHISLLVNRGSKKCNTILPGSKDAGDYDQVFLGEIKETVHKRKTLPLIGMKPLQRNKVRQKHSSNTTVAKRNLW